jgi:hypothetical protein
LAFPSYSIESVMAKRSLETSACAELAALALTHAKAAGIDVGDASHWVCIDADGGDAAVRGCQKRCQEPFPRAIGEKGS